MRLYVLKEEKKIYLNETAKTRVELINNFGASSFKIDDDVYNIRDVQAEYKESNGAATAVIGGVIGIIGGGVGVAIGSAIGAAIGSLINDEDKDAADKFNRSGVL